MPQSQEFLDRRVASRKLDRRDSASMYTHCRIGDARRGGHRTCESGWRGRFSCRYCSHALIEPRIEVDRDDCTSRLKEVPKKVPKKYCGSVRQSSENAEHTHQLFAGAVVPQTRCVPRKPRLRLLTMTGHGSPSVFQLHVRFLIPFLPPVFVRRMCRCPCNCQRHSTDTLRCNTSCPTACLRSWLVLLRFVVRAFLWLARTRQLPVRRYANAALASATVRVCATFVAQHPHCRVLPADFPS